MSNSGGQEAVVLNKLRASAGVKAGPDGVSVLTDPLNPAVCLLEWSAPEGCDLLDPYGVAQANPSLGYLIGWDTIASQAALDPIDVFRTEVLCQTVESLDSALDLNGWKAGRDPGTMDALRDHLALGVDVSIDGQHVTAVVAGEVRPGVYRIEVIGSWPGLVEARRDLRGLIDLVKPSMTGWFPGGPAAGLAPELRATEDSNALSGVEVGEACSGFASLVAGGAILHSGDPLLDAQVPNTGWTWTGDAKRFARRGASHVDAVYASAAAVHILRTVEIVSIPAPMIV